MFQESQKIGQYTLIRKLGQGGFGEVWLAERQGKFVTTKVAVKLPLSEQVDHEAIRQEATLWEQASGHPNVMPIIEADEYDGQIVIVSEYAPDGSLDEWLKTNGAMPVERAIETTIQILDGLEFLHSRNIIHRDLKPANILLQGSTPRLADFGISRALRTTVASQSQNISGTFAYMSPEALDGKRSVQSDIWSVGVNLYQFLTGMLPFPQKEPSVLFPSIIMREFVPLPDSIPPSLKNVIATALAKLPENRYASAVEMREDLRRILRGEMVSNFIQSDSHQSYSASEIPPTQKSFPIFANSFQDETATVVRLAPTSDKNKKHKSFNGWMYGTLALGFVIAIFFGIYFSMNQSKQSYSNKSEAVQISATNSSSDSVNIENINSLTTLNTNLNTPTPTPTPISYTGSYGYSKGDLFGNLKINEFGKNDPKPFKFSFQVGRTGRCVGEIAGTAKWVKDNLAVASIKNDSYVAGDSYSKPFCRLTFVFSGKRVKVLQDSCSAFSGAECGFEGTYNK